MIYGGFFSWSECSFSFSPSLYQCLSFCTISFSLSIHRAHNTQALALASVSRDFFVEQRPTTTATMITSKCYSENRFEMAFKIRHTKLWTNAIKMHIHFHNVHVSARDATLAHHSHTIKQINRAILIRNWTEDSASQPATHKIFTQYPYFIVYRKELLFAAIFSSFRYIGWMFEKKVAVNDSIL